MYSSYTQAILGRHRCELNILTMYLYGLNYLANPMSIRVRQFVIDSKPYGLLTVREPLQLELP